MPPRRVCFALFAVPAVTGRREQPGTGRRRQFPRRWAPFGIAALLLVLTFGAQAAAATGSAGTPAQRCLPAGPVTAQSYQQLFNGWHDAAFSGGDQTYSMLLPDGRSLWLFADTEQGPMTASGARGPGRTYVHNSIMIWDGRCAHLVDPGGHAAVMPNDPDGSFYWSSVAAVDRGDLQVFALKTHATGPGTLDFQTTGTSLFTFSLKPGSDPVLSRRQPLPGDGTWQWGAAVTADSGYVYVYATAKSAQPLVFGKGVRVARAPAGGLAQLSTWTYWTGSNWSPSESDATDILPAEVGPSSTFAVHQHPDGSWELTSKQFDMLGDWVAAWSAPHPWGPWTLDNPNVLQAPSFSPTPNTLAYNSFTHPEVQLSSGKLLMTVDRNTTSGSEFMADANAYMPQFFEIPLDAVGGRLLPVVWPSATAPSQVTSWGVLGTTPHRVVTVTPRRITGSWGRVRSR